MQIKTILREPQFWASGVALLIAAWLLVPQLMPSRPPATTGGQPEIRYICRKSGELFTLAATADSLPHPVTGRLTLVPAVFERRSGKWKPGPTLAVMHRRGLLTAVSTP